MSGENKNPLIQLEELPKDDEEYLTESEIKVDQNNNNNNNSNDSKAPLTPLRDRNDLRLASAAQFTISPNATRWKSKTSTFSEGEYTRPSSILLPEFPTDDLQFPLSQDDHRNLVKRRNFFFVVLLILTGLATALAGFLSDWAIEGVFKLRFIIHDAIDNFFGQLLIWLIIPTLASVSVVYLTRLIAPESAGSGIPEMKAMFSGTRLDGYLGPQVLVAKLLGLVIMLGSGFSIGKEGPFAHIGCVIANQFARVKFFGFNPKIPEMKIKPELITLFGAALAGGVAASFGSPIGGVLFSIEVSATYYPLRNYWSAYVTSLSSVLFFRYLFNAKNGNAGFSALLPTHQSPETDFGIVELFIFFMLGLFCGLLSILFIKFHSWASKKYRMFKEQYPAFASPFYLAFVISILTGLVTFPWFGYDFLAKPGLASTFDMYCVDNQTVTSSCLNAEGRNANWGHPIPSLLFTFLARFFLIPLTMLLPVPAGLYTPLIATGAAIGRVVGEIMFSIFQGHILEGGVISPGVYAVVGGGALTGGITHTLSSAVIAFELTGQIYYLVPVLIAVSTSVFLAKRFSSLSIYDSISKDRGLRYLPDLAQSSYQVVAQDIMQKKIPFLTKEFNYDDCIKALSHDRRIFPVVESKESYLLVGQVERRDLKEATEQFFGVQREKQKRLSKSMEKVKESESELQLQVPLKSVPIQFLQSTTLSEIHLLFTTMHMEEAFVTDMGRLVGSIDRKTLKHVITKKDAFLTILSD